MILDTVIIIALLSVAILLVILELFFLPGLSVAGFLSVVFYGVAIYYSFSHLGSVVGLITLVVAVLLTLLFIWYFMRSRTLDKMSLHTNIDNTAPTRVNQSISVGDCGVTLSRLNPMGKVLIGDITVEARAIEFIDESTEVRVVKIDATNVMVEPIEK